MLKGAMPGNNMVLMTVSNTFSKPMNEVRVTLLMRSHLTSDRASDPLKLSTSQMAMHYSPGI